MINGYAKEPIAKQYNAFMLVGRANDQGEYQHGSKRTGIHFVFFNDPSLTVKEPTNPILTSEHLTYPCDRSIDAVH